MPFCLFVLFFWNASEQETQTQILSCPLHQAVVSARPPTPDTRLNISRCAPTEAGRVAAAKPFRLPLQMGEARDGSRDERSAGSGAWAGALGGGVRGLDGVALCHPRGPGEAPGGVAAFFRRQWRSRVCCAWVRRRRSEDAAGSRATPGPGEREREWLQTLTCWGS